MSVDYDVLVLGDGPIAHGFVLAMGEADLRVAVIDTAPHPQSSEQKGERSVALALASLRVLAPFGVHPDDRDSGRIAAVQISQEGGRTSAKLHHQLLQVPEACLGRVLPLNQLATGLSGALEQLQSPPMRQHLGIPDNCRWYADRVEMDWAQGTRLSARLVILAHGGHGRMEQLLGLRRVGWDHNRYAFVARVGHGGRAGDTAYEHFLRSGPLALLPLPADQGFSLVWSLLPSKADQLLRADDKTFLHVLNGNRPVGVPVLTQVTGRAIYPLHFQSVTASARSRVLPLGNAAQTLHPLAGQGYNLGLRDAITAGALLREAASRGEDPGSSRLLADFQRIRRQDRLETMAFTEGMNRLFGLAPLHPGRALAMRVLEYNPRAKALLAARLAGVRLPASSTIPDLQAPALRPNHGL